MMHVVVRNRICLPVYLDIDVCFLNNDHSWAFWFGRLLRSDGVGINKLTHLEGEVVLVMF